MAALIGPAGALADAVTVTAERLNVRTEASAQSKSVVVVSKDEKLQFISASGDWIRVMTNGKPGYVMKSYVSVDKASIASDVAASQTIWSQAQSGTATARVNLRALPMTDADIVKVIDAGKAVTLTGECGDWYVASYGGGTGYVMKEYIRYSASAGTETGSSSASNADVPTVGVTNTRVNLRAAASTGSKVIKILDKGTTVSLNGLNGSWYQVTVGGVSGYVSSQYVNTQGVRPTAAPVEDAETTFATPLSGTTNTRVNLRARADTKSGVVKVIEKNASVTLTGEKGAWYKASSGGKTGYIYKQYVNAGGAVAPTPTAAPTATPVPQPGDSSAASETTYTSPVPAKANVRVNMRANAAQNAALVKVISKDEAVSVLGEKGDWYKISSGNKTGYAAKPYITLQGAAATPTPAPTASPYQSWTGVTSVEVNMRRAPEGDVIYVLQAGTEVTVTGANGSWYMIDYRGSAGYVASSYVVRKDEASTGVTPTPAPNATQAPGQGTAGYVTGAYVNVRSGAGSDYGVIATLRMGDQVTLYEQTDGWYRMTGGGVSGYISAKYVSPDKPSGNATPAPSDSIGKVVNSDWWTGVISTAFKTGTIATVTDVETGLSFQVKRTGGTNHADAQPLTAADTSVMYRIYSYKWQWTRRAIWVTVGGVTYAASMNGMPHGDSDSMPDNNFDGCFCIHFLNSRTHSGNRLDAAHQAAVAKALKEGNK
ncbi:MAG: SH3 domain-containing protein [Clostridia bacterium]|nr:SH3 domain-containing protein [Clostridia bacterium]